MLSTLIYIVVHLLIVRIIYRTYSEKKYNNDP